MEKKDKATIDKVAIGEVEDAFLASLDKLSASSEPFSAFLSHLRASENTEIGQILRLEKKDFDLTWIEKIEEGMPEIDKIVENPRQFIKQERDVIPAVKIKRVSSESIQHLASHSYFVREIDEESGNVTPDKLLSVENEEDLAIYENRFVKTLILKLYTFVSVRYDYLMEHRETRDSEVMTLHNVTEIDGVRYEFDTRVKCSRSSEKEEDRKKHDEVMERIFRIGYKPEPPAYHRNFRLPLYNPAPPEPRRTIRMPARPRPSAPSRASRQGPGTPHGGPGGGPRPGRR